MARTARTPRTGRRARLQPYSTNRRSRRNRSNKPFEFPSPPKTAGQLEVKDVDLHLKLNRNNHNTGDYEAEGLILRRGQPFRLAVNFSRPFVGGKDEISLEMHVGKRPRVMHGTRVIISPVDSPVENDWGFQVDKTAGNQVELTVYTSADAIVLPYTFIIETTTETGDECRYQHQDEIILLFNPWCKDDDVYMEDPAKRAEYVLNDVTQYYWGSSNTIGGSPWYLGQFDQVALQCAFHLLRKSRISQRSLNNPILVVRILSALLNAEDDEGVLQGNWSGDYRGGTDPSDWTGSPEILSEYMHSGKPVGYGQCWVFGGIFTTVMRALGIPSRTITNFDSAHDTDENLSLDYHFSQDGQPLEDMNDDSVWNFHVWNDCWMARPDLPQGHGGWQAIDATPQETSRGIYRAGPTSLEAIKRGDVHLSYDTKFLFAEVNAETATWIVPNDRKKIPEIATVETSNVGNFISTKAVGSDQRDDITLQYKFPEGSDRERAAILLATSHIRSAKRLYKKVKKDITFDFDVDKEVMVGKPFGLSVRATNVNKQEARQFFISVTCNAVYYTGVKASQVTQKKEQLQLKPGKSLTFRLDVTLDQYLDHLTDAAAFKFLVMASVPETRQAYAGQQLFQFRKPDLRIEVEGDLKVGEPFQATVSCSNPLPKELRNCFIRVSGPGIKEYLKTSAKNIPAGKEMSHIIKLTPKRAGKRKLVAVLHSDELKGVSGVTELNIE